MTLLANLPSQTAPAVAPDPSPARRWRPRDRHGWATLGIGAMTAVLYTYALSRVGWGNDYYAAAVRAGAESWKAFFFGAIDPGSFITVDKPPAALWLMSLSARIFGFNVWSMLLPEAAAGVASVLILHRLVRRWAGDVAAHLAALAFALTPVAAVMFRYNNPDALLTFLLLAAAWALWKAVETGRTLPLLGSAALVGLAFQTKMLQAFLVLPAFVLVYLWAGPPKFGRRMLQLTAALGVLIVSIGWWVAIVALWPAGSRPYIGSTTDNSIVSLITGYNGLNRIFGGEGPGGGPGGAGGPGGGFGGGFGGAPGWFRLFNSTNAGQISWLLPLAAAGLVAGLWLTRRAGRSDVKRAGWLLWGGWAAVSVAVFSLSKGIYHEYYTVALAPAVAALAGAGAVALFHVGRIHRLFRFALPAAIVGSGVWAVVVLHRSPTFHSWLRSAIPVGAASAAAGVWAVYSLRRKWLLHASAVVAAAAVLAGPTAYAVTSVLAPRGGAIVSAGPGAIGNRGPGGGGRIVRGGGAGEAQAAANAGLYAYLEANKGSATYLVAAFGSNSSAPIIIATGEPVITIGGFGGRDPAPTLAEFQRLIAEGKVRYVLLGGGGGGGGFGDGPGGGGGGGGSISSWVTANGTLVPATEYGGTGAGSLYDLSAARQ